MLQLLHLLETSPLHPFGVRWLWLSSLRRRWRRSARRSECLLATMHTGASRPRALRRNVAKPACKACCPAAIAATSSTSPKVANPLLWTAPARPLLLSVNNTYGRLLNRAPDRARSPCACPTTSRWICRPTSCWLPGRRLPWCVRLPSRFPPGGGATMTKRHPLAG